MDTVDGMIGNPFDDAPEIRFRVKTMQLGCLDQAVDGRGPLAAGVGTGERPIVAAQGY